ncbi:MAG: ATP-binding protein [Microscillaceae bacterium]|nr:ATP-binding protein [Microscillaceae bacterium]MDW8460359.1 ATP-binding protein [Cytophagales bacterium]
MRRYHHYYKANARKESLIQIREFVSAALKNLMLSDIENNQLVLAVDEICSNLIIHASQDNPNQIIELNIKDCNDELIFEITDYNNDSFDPNTNYQTPNLQKLINDKRKGGMGLMLVSRIMDSVEVRRERGYSLWRMTKKFLRNNP